MYKFLFSAIFLPRHAHLPCSCSLMKAKEQHSLHLKFSRVPMCFSRIKLSVVTTSSLCFFPCVSSSSTDKEGTTSLFSSAHVREGRGHRTGKKKCEIRHFLSQWVKFKPRTPSPSLARGNWIRLICSSLSRRGTEDYHLDYIMQWGNTISISSIRNTYLYRVTMAHKLFLQCAKNVSSLV